MKGRIEYSVIFCNLSNYLIKDFGIKKEYKSRFFRVEKWKWNKKVKVINLQDLLLPT